MEHCLACSSQSSRAWCQWLRAVRAGSLPRHLPGCMAHLGGQGAVPPSDQATSAIPSLSLTLVQLHCPFCPKAGAGRPFTKAPRGIAVDTTALPFSRAFCWRPPSPLQIEHFFFGYSILSCQRIDTEHQHFPPTPLGMFKHVKICSIFDPKPINLTECSF